MDIPEKLAAVLISFIVIAFSAIIGGLLVMWLWNWLMPSLFGLPTLNFWQSWGLSFLGGLLFGRVNVSK